MVDSHLGFNTFSGGFAIYRVARCDIYIMLDSERCFINAIWLLLYSFSGVCTAIKQYVYLLWQEKQPTTTTIFKHIHKLLTEKLYI